MRVLFVTLAFCAFCSFRAVKAGSLPQASSRPTFLLIAMPKVNSKQNYTSDQWATRVQNLRPQADKVDAAPIIQEMSAGKVVKKNNLISSQIIGGSEATLGQFPWQALLIADKVSLCGGSLILANWILTAAHCAIDKINFDVSLGLVDVTDASSERVDFNTKEKFIHANYSRTTKLNDIALIKLPINVTLTANIQLVKLPPVSDATTTFEDVEATVSGFGWLVEGGPTSDLLQTAQLTVISNSVCMESYAVISSSTLCTKVGDKNICTGDSGGPLVYQDSTNSWVQIGIVSFGAATCMDGPAAYARVTSFLGWISDTIAQSDSSSGEQTAATVSSTLTELSTETLTTEPSESSTTTMKTTAKTGETNSTKTTKPLNCTTADFSNLHTCCETKRRDVVGVKRNYKNCKNTNPKVFNKFFLNKQIKASNNFINFTDSRVQKALYKDACFANCFLKSKFLIANKQINETALKNYLPRSNRNYAWGARIKKGLSDCLEMPSNKLVGNFVSGKTSCPGIGLVVMQCTIKKSIENCPVESRSTAVKCQKAWAAFDYCKNYIF